MVVRRHALARNPLHLILALIIYVRDGPFESDERARQLAILEVNTVFYVLSVDKARHVKVLNERDDVLLAIISEA